LLGLLEGISLILLALPPLVLGCVYVQYQKLLPTTLCWTVVAWGALEFLLLLFAGRRHGGLAIKPSARRATYGVTAALVTVGLLLGVNSGWSDWKNVHWFLLGLLPLLAGLVYRVHAHSASEGAHEPPSSSRTRTPHRK